MGKPLSREFLFYRSGKLLSKSSGSGLCVAREPRLPRTDATRWMIDRTSRNDLTSTTKVNTAFVQSQGEKLFLRIFCGTTCSRSASSTGHRGELWLAPCSVSQPKLLPPIKHICAHSHLAKARANARRSVLLSGTMREWRFTLALESSGKVKQPWLLGWLPEAIVCPPRPVSKRQ